MAEFASESRIDSLPVLVEKSGFSTHRIQKSSMRQRREGLGSKQAPHDQTGFVFLLAESENRVARRTQHRRDVLGRTVADAQPNHLQRTTQEHTAFMEVRSPSKRSPSFPLWRNPKSTDPRRSRDRIPTHGGNREINPRVRQPAGAAGSHRRAVSNAQQLHPTLPIRGEGQAGENIFFHKIGEFSQNLSVRHSARQVFQHVINRDAETRLPRS